MRLYPALLRAVAACMLSVMVCGRAASAGAFDALLEKPLDNALAGALKADLPITLDDNDLLPTIDSASLPGGAFSGKALHPTLADLDKPLAPGDYIVPVMAFCMKYSIHQGAPGTAYEMAPLRGKAAAAISALIFRGYTVQHRSPSELQAVSWTIQSGTPYPAMPLDMRRVIDSVIPEYRNALSGDAITKITSTYDSVPLARKPPLEDVLRRLGPLGQLTIGALQVRAALAAATTDASLRNQALFAGQGRTAAQPASIAAQDGPWTVVVPGVAYERPHILAGNLGYNELQVRVLPQHVSLRQHATRRIGERQVGVLPIAITLAEVLLEAAAAEEAGTTAAIVGSRGLALVRLAAPVVQAQTLMLTMMASNGNGSNGPSKADCKTAIKILTQFERLAQKFGITLSPDRLAHLKALRDAGTITANDLPAGLRSKFPFARDEKLSDIQAKCGQG